MNNKTRDKDIYIPIPTSLKLKGTIIFLLFYAAFFLYLKLIVGTNVQLMYYVNSIILILFLLTSYKVKFGLYLFIFLMPLLNSSANFMIDRPRYIVVFMFFGLFLGFIVNKAGTHMQNYPNNGDDRFIFDRTVMKLMIAFSAVLVISCAITIFRYGNLYPLITNDYHDLAINVNNVRSTNSMIWTLRFFFNYMIGFLFFLLIINTLKNIREILGGLIAIIAATMVSVGVVLYQYFIDPYMGNAEHWVDSGRFNATFVDPNALGAYTIILFPVFIGMIMYFKRWYVKTLLIVSFLLFLLLILFSGSRSAFIGILLATGIFIVIFIIRGINKLRGKSVKWSKRKRFLVPFVIIILIVCLLLALVYLFVFQEELLSNFGLIDRTIKTFKTGIYYFSKYGLAEGLKSISNFRYVFWGQAVEMARDYPIAGVGQGAYILQLPNYLLAGSTGFRQVDYSGNYYLQILSEQGIVGLIIIISLFFVLIKRVLSYFIKKKKAGHTAGYEKSVWKGIEKEDWILAGLFISFISMLVGQIFGPHTNFNEIQLTFWLIVGLMISYVIFRKKDKARLAPITIVDKMRFTLREKISLSIVLFIFFSIFMVSSVTTLSLNVNQNLYNTKGDYVGWQNYYGIYDEEVSEEGPYSWIAPDASLVLEKKGDKIVIPLKDAYPEVREEKLGVKIFIDNLLVEKTYLDYNEWENIEINIPSIARSYLTLTIVFERGWSPKGLGINNDTREFGGQIGKIYFID